MGDKMTARQLLDRISACWGSGSPEFEAAAQLVEDAARGAQAEARLVLVEHELRRREEVLSVGDRVVVTDTDYNVNGNPNLANGKTGTVIGVVGTSAVDVRMDEGPQHAGEEGNGWCFFVSQVRKLGAEEDAATNATSHEGDRA